MSKELKQLSRSPAGTAPHYWRCRLDGKHGSREVWECSCGDHVYGNPHTCSAHPGSRATQHDYLDIVADMLKAHCEPDLAKAVRRAKRIMPNCEVV